ncbi:MAG: site-specific integrase [Planctomycetaceae bacterium]|jgi:integrase|nr:site-specific integrase [Planctomycetaceae bacterium]MBT6487308.1 site-specific integrase [Planctomycetaceae bacterium]MBT6494956.1 site-specific integrase [Planctomycetaceae bacterium]
MASLFRPVKTRYVDADGKRTKKNSLGSRKVNEKSKAWHGKYRDADGIERRQKLSTNKAAARQMLAELERKAEQQKAGLCSPFEEHATRPLTEHLADFHSNLRDAGNTHDYCRLVFRRACWIVEGCRFRFIGDISASRVQSFLSDLKKKGRSQQTINHYLRAIKQFTRWLVRDRRTSDNRLTHLAGGNVKTDLRIERRELTGDEIQQLLKIAQTGRSRMGLSGWERFTLYSTALSTGLRASELSSLTPAHFGLTGEPPTVRIDAADEKAGRGDVLPLPPDLVELLAPWLETVDDDSPLWPGVWAKQKRGSRFIQRDLEDARSTWIGEAESEAEHGERERSDFLCYRDHDGKQADFHALRHTYLSRLGRSGASPKAMQRLARHSSVELTLGRYTHVGLFDLAAAVERLPLLPVKTPDKSEPAVLRATGTDAGRDSLGAPLGAPVRAKSCGTMTTGEETNTSGDDEEPSPQLVSWTTIEDE